MKHKRLNRDGWGFQYYPYYQMRIDEDFFHGIACLLRLTDGEANYWETPKAGRIHEEKALSYFQDKFHCSQSVLAAYAVELGLTEEQALKIA